MTEKHELFLARDRGFCGGVRAALATLDRLLKEHPGEPVYVLHELVHNRHVTGEFERRGVHFVPGVEQIPSGALLLLGAHGVPPALEQAAKERTPRITDATCPLVKVRQHEAAGVAPDETLILLGYPGHPEVTGILGYRRDGACVVISNRAEAERLPDAVKPVLLTQTTFDAEELRLCREILERRFPDLSFRGGLCRASQERQRSVTELARQVELVVVAGSAHSSNARRLCEAAERAGAGAVLVEGAADIPARAFELRRVGLTAGASTPDADVEEMENSFASAGFAIIDSRKDQK